MYFKRKIHYFLKYIIDPPIIRLMEIPYFKRLEVITVFCYYIVGRIDCIAFWIISIVEEPFKIKKSEPFRTAASLYSGRS